MDLNRLRRLAAEVDDEHREAMRTIHQDVGAAVFDADATTRANRRGFLHKLGLGGTVLTVGTTAIALSARGAGAQTTTTTPGSTAPATTTTLPPKQPTQEDLAILAFAQSLELAVVAAYRLALPKLTDPVLPVAVTFALHHEQHAQALGGLAGKAALGIANQSLVDSFGPRMESARTEPDVLRLAWELETAAASTYVAVLGEVESTNSAEIIASIQPIEARHAAVIGQALELPLSELAPAFVSPDDAATPSEYPIIAR